MKTQIRHGVFETNSSSTHSITLCSKEQFEAFKRGEYYWGRSGVVPAEEVIEEAKESYERYREDGEPHWDELSDEAKAIEIREECEYRTHNDWRGGSLDTFCKKYTTPGGEEVVAFGEFGYD